MVKGIGADAACEILYKLPTSPGTELVPLSGALNRVLAGDVCAEIPVPPFDRSPFDGYAFRGEDTYGADAQNPAILKVAEEIPAGVFPKIEITAGFASKILTGAPIPAGANATIKYEKTEFSETEVRLFEQINPNTDIVRAGSDIMRGDVIALSGALVTEPVVSSFANQGMSHVRVYKKPAITVISTGTELCEVGTPLRPAAIYNSNVYTIAAYLENAGVDAINGGSVPDDPAVIAAQIKDALATSDMVITTGGASVGDYDFALASATALGADVLFWKIALKPGGAIMAAQTGGKVILALSGNPAAAVIGLMRIAMPYIKKLCGRRDCFFPEIRVRLKDAFNKESDKTRILRGRLEIIDGMAYFAESTGQGSEKISSLIGCDLLAELPIGAKALPRETIVRAYKI